MSLCSGQKASSLAQVVTTLQERGAMEYTILVAERGGGLILRLHYNTYTLIQQLLRLNI